MDQDVIALFHELANRSPAEREECYAERNVSTAVRDEVESLLRFDLRSQYTLRGYVAEAAADAVLAGDGVPAGSRYGSYRVVRLLGRGGMGAVYEAEQDSPRRIVALKVITAGLASPEVMRRFEQESQALGRLQHPGIAQIYEAGTADTGLGTQPYFAMELVRGDPLPQHADAQGLDTRQRLELIARVCEAVDHAHQRGIIHRDLKPANILVDATGQPKILDFGVARMTDGDVRSTRQTDVGQLIGTLAYMSPEQVLADPLELDTRSDVYALGVILYELLAKRPPYQTTGRLHEVMQSIQESDPTPLGMIARAYRGDIETIAAKSLEKEKARRYGSVAALAADIRLFLQDEPILARPPGTLYQLQKFAKRRKALVTGVAAVFVALVAGVIVSTRQASRARRAERATAEEAATAKAINEFLRNDLLAQASAYGQAKPGTDPDPDLKVRTALDRAAATIAGKFDKQPLIEASIRSTIGGTYADLGLYSEAQAQLERAVDLRCRILGNSHPETFTAMNRLAETHIARGGYSQAEPLAITVVEARRRVLGEEHPDTLASMFLLAELCRMQRKPEQAEAIINRLVPVQRRVRGVDHPDTLDSIHLLAVVYRLQGKYAEAESLFESSVEARGRVQGKEHPDTLHAINDLGVLYEAQGRYARAAALVEGLLAVERRVLGEEHPTTAVSMFQLAVLYRREGNYAAAEPLHARAVDVERRLLGEESANTLTMMNLLGLLYLEEGKFDRAQSVLDQVQAARRRVLGEENPDTLVTSGFLAQLYRSRGEYAAAEALLGHVQEVRRRVQGMEHPATLTGMHEFGVLYMVQGKHEQAEAVFSQALDGRRRVLGETHPDTLASMLGLAESYQRQCEYLHAEPLAREALDGYEKTWPDNWNHYKAQSVKGAILAAQERFAEAEPLLLSGQQGLVERSTTIPAEYRRALDEAGARIVELYQDWGQPQKAAEWRSRLASKPPS